MKIKRFLRRFNITILCLMAVHILLTIIFGMLFYALFFDWRWYLQLFIIGFVCEQLYIAATEQESKRVRRMRILAAIFAVCSSVHIQITNCDVMKWYVTLLIVLWTLCLWVEARKRDPERKTQNITNWFLTVIYACHVAAEFYGDYLAYGLYKHPFSIIASDLEYVLFYFLPWVILINMGFLAVRTYQNLTDD